MNSAKQNTEAARTQYRNLMNTMVSKFGWTPARFNDECKGLAEYFMAECHQDKAQAYVSAAREVVSVNRENRDA